VVPVAEHFQEDILKARLAFQTEPLGLVFFEMRHETNQIGDLRVNPSEGMGKWDAAQNPDTVAFPGGQHGRLTVSILIHRDNQCAIEGGKEKRTRGVAQVMVKIDYLTAARISAQHTHVV
jgi:hypothetical protein